MKNILYILGLLLFGQVTFLKTGQAVPVSTGTEKVIYREDSSKKKRRRYHRNRLFNRRKPLTRRDSLLLEAKKQSPSAKKSLVFGILSLTAGSLFAPLVPIFGVIALVYGIKSFADREPYTRGATWGIVLGILAILYTVIFVFIILMLLGLLTP